MSIRIRKTDSRGLSLPHEISTLYDATEVFLRANVDDPTAELQRNLKRFSFMFLLLFSVEKRFTQMLSEKTLFSLQRFFLICSICLLPLSCYLVKSFVVWQKSKTEIMKQFKISSFGVTLIWLWNKEHVVRGGQILLELFIDSYIFTLCLVAAQPRFIPVCSALLHSDISLREFKRSCLLN